MPKLDETFETAQESTAGGGSDFKRMEPGIYMCRIQAVQDEWETSQGVQRAADKQCVRVVVDVDEGDLAGEFSREFYEGRDWMHAFYMSWKPSAMGMLKHTFKALDEANPGFDSRAAFEADKWLLFTGKRVRVLWNGRESTNTRGYVNVNCRPDRAICADENPKPKVELERGGKVDWTDYAAEQAAQSSTPAVPAAAYDSTDVPF